MIEREPLRGFRDIIDDMADRIILALDAARELAKAHGFKEVFLPTLESIGDRLFPIFYKNYQEQGKVETVPDEVHQLAVGNAMMVLTVAVTFMTSLVPLMTFCCMFHSLCRMTCSHLCTMFSNGLCTGYGMMRTLLYCSSLV